MLSDSENLAAFYDSPMGLVTRRLIQRRLRLLWPDLSGQRVLGYGFAVPYLRAFALEAERVIALMPEQQGAFCWPDGCSLSLIADEEGFPFPDAMFDRVLMVHGIEGAESVRSLMRQVWRSLAPAGRLLVVAPNRASLWAQVDRSPFSHGRPFTRAQLDRVLRESMFLPERWDTALLMPPIKSRRLVRTGAAWEKTAQILWPRLAGVHLVEATKSMYAIAPVRALKKPKRFLTPAPA
ncbi:MAG TPA: methyltransferase domain-containing protein [Rhizomicrobium sp.]|jgi:SAM-dependent methyltransferase|nr:methyltransferase domain-containing protein [Rhizomicrobium sp.]